MKRPLLYLLSFFGLGLLLAGCAGMQQVLKNPEVTLADVRLTSMSLQDAQFAFDVDVKNPNPIGVTLHGLSYNISLQEKPLYNGALQNRTRIEADATTRASIPVNIRYEDLFGSLSALKGQKELHYQISGEADLGLIRIPYNKSGTLPLPQLPDVAIEDLRINKLGLTGAELALAVKVANSNTFPLRLNGLLYDLKVGGTPLFKGESSTPLNVAPNGNGKMLLTMHLDYAQLGKVMQLLNSSGPIPVELDSQLKVPGPGGEKQIPYHWRGDVPLSR